MLQTMKTADAPVSNAETLTLKNMTGEITHLPGFAGHEEVWLGVDETRGLTAIVAIHNTALGPALGGTRVWKHDSLDDAINDALRLSHGMTLKSAIAGAPFGGGKAVIWADAEQDKTPQLLEAYADMLFALQDRFYTGEDVGLSLANADFLRERTPNVTGTTRGGSGNPSPVTARGVFVGLRAAVIHHYGSDRLREVTVAVQGLGSVGWALCEMLDEAGARLIVADIDEARCLKARDLFGAKIVDVKDILASKADVFAPCALGGGLTPETIPLLKVDIVAGAANNQLLDEADAKMLEARGILYAPDYVINAGGLLNVAAELAPGGYDRNATLARVEKIADTLGEIFRRSDETGTTTNILAERIANERIEAALQG